MANTGTRYPNGINIPSGKLFIDSVAATPSLALAGITATAAEVNVLAGVTAGTVAASKAIVADANKQVTELGLSTGATIKGSRFEVVYPQVAAADVAKTFFIANVACKIISAYERHVTVAGQAGVLNVEKLTSGQAPASGAVTLTTGWDLTSTANTPVSIATLGTAAATLAAGDALCLKLTSGAATSYALATIALLMEWA